MIAYSELTAMFRKKGVPRRPAQMAAMVCEGLNNKQIAKHFDLAERTVKNYLTIVYQTVHVSSRLELAVWCLKQQIEVARKQERLSVSLPVLPANASRP